MTLVQKDELIERLFTLFAVMMTGNDQAMAELVVMRLQSAWRTFDDFMIVGGFTSTERNLILQMIERAESEVLALVE